MKRFITVLLFIVLVLPVVTSHAQNVNKDTTGKKKTVKPPPPIPVYLGHSNRSGGSISKTLFDSLLKQGLTARDTAGNEYRILGFMFTYAEMNLYEDSAGKLQLMTDLRAEYCPGDTITNNIARTIYQRTKVGDTVYFDQLTLRRMKDSAGAAGRPMEFDILSR